MTFKDFFCSLLISHVLSTFYLQISNKQLKPCHAKIVNHIIYSMITVITLKIICVNIEWY